MSGTAGGAVRLRARLGAPSLYAALAAALFGDVLLGPPGRVLSAPGTDVVGLFASSRAFGFGELARGNLALWNPQLFSGYPYLGGFQPALLYPPNLLHLLLPVERAINLLLVLHVCLAGCFTWLWLRRSGAGGVAAMLGGVAYMLCAPCFLHVYAGHLPQACVLPWVPLLLYAVEACFPRVRPAPVAVGALALSMMTLAGYPQMVLYAALVVPLHALWRWREARAPARALLGPVCMAALAAGPCALQVLPAFDAVAESLRGGPGAAALAATYSFPPENLLTLLAPGALGPVAPTADAPLGYVGQAYPWEMTAFVGATVGCLALLGVLAGGRPARLPAGMAALALLLALGANTPVHGWLVDAVPGFALFRGASKFLFLACLYVAALAAAGYDALAAGATRLRAVAAVAAVSVLLAAAGAAVHASAPDGPDGWLGRALAAVAARGEARGDLHYPPGRWADPAAVESAGRAGAASLLRAGAWTGGVCALVLLLRRRPRAAPVVALLAAAELFAFARGHRPVTPVEPPLPREWAAALDALPAGQRFVRNPSMYDAVVRRWPVLDAWGYEPGVLRRYAELMQAGQGFDPDEATSDLGFRDPAPGVLRTARVGLVLESSPRPAAFRLGAPPLPHGLLVPGAEVLPGRDAILARMLEPGFDPARTVLLESPPRVAPAAGEPVPVPVQVVDSDTRRIEVQAGRPAILLVTESWSRHWRATALAPPPPGQDGYRLMPGDWAFLALPLAAGHHVIGLEYAPRSVAIGRAVSLGTLAALAVAAVVALVAWSRRR